MQRTRTSAAAAVRVDTCEKAGNLDDTAYNRFLKAFQTRVLVLLRDGEPVFETTACGEAALWPVYLDNIKPKRQKQYHTCHACRRFIARFGGLAQIDPDTGRLLPLMWAEVTGVPKEMREALVAMREKVTRAKVTGVFLSSEKKWGEPKTGVWTHLGVVVPKSVQYPRNGALTASQAMAVKVQDFEQVERALGEFPLPLLEQMGELIEGEDLERSEKVRGPGLWLRDLKRLQVKLRGGRRFQHLLWLAVAKAPEGFCHPRASVLGSLLEDLQSGASAREVQRRFREKMDPRKYQRPVAAPSDGAIQQAERLVEKLGLEPALRRRFARLDEIPQWLWKPTSERRTRTPGTGVFSHLRTREASPQASAELATEVVTWASFASKVLPRALAMEVLIPWTNSNYSSFLTAVDDEAPPLFQWDSLEQRNPFSWYVVQESKNVPGCRPAKFSLTSGVWVPVTAVLDRPCNWFGGQFDHFGDAALLVLKGARDVRMSEGLCLFPETLRGDLHGVRSVIEAYSKEGTLEGRDEADVAGISLEKGWCQATVRVARPGKVFKIYKIDRWE